MGYERVICPFDICPQIQNEPADCSAPLQILCAFLILVFGYLTPLASGSASDEQMTLKAPGSEPKNIVIIGMPPFTDSMPIFLTSVCRRRYHRLFDCILPHAPCLLQSEDPFDSHPGGQQNCRRVFRKGWWSPCRMGNSEMSRTIELQNSCSTG